MSIDSTQDLAEILSEAWRYLQRGASDSRHAFHTPVVATVSAAGCEVRTVVLRRVDVAARELVFHTDFRSEKVRELSHQPTLSWLFYSAPDKIQIRAQGQARLYHLDEVARQAWESSRLSSRRCYLAEPGPGTAVTEPISGLPPHLLNRSPANDAESEPGWPNFCVVVCTVTRLEWLYLAASGHRRAVFQFSPTDMEYQASWLIP